MKISATPARVLAFVGVCTPAKVFPESGCLRMAPLTRAVFMTLWPLLVLVMLLICPSFNALLTPPFMSLVMKVIRRNGVLGYLCSIMIPITLVRVEIVKRVKAFVDLLVWISRLLAFAPMGLTPQSIALAEVISFSSPFKPLFQIFFYRVFSYKNLKIIFHYILFRIIIILLPNI